MGCSGSKPFRARSPLAAGCSGWVESESVDEVRVH